MDRASLWEGRVVGGSAWIAALGEEVVYEEDLPLAAGAAPFTTTNRSSARYAARCGGNRCLCNPRRTPSHSAKSVEEQRREEIEGERRSSAKRARGGAPSGPIPRSSP